jgi:predicted Zn-dependent protease
MSSDDLRSNTLVRFVPIVLALIAGAVIVAKGCQEGPFGRHQIVGLTPQEEAQLGLQAFQQTLRESDVLPDSDPATETVQKIGRLIAQAAGMEEVRKAIGLRPQKFAWEFKVVRSKQVNAFCLPGGKVVVYTGILPVAETEAGLATVMGHEIGHALAHHGAERMAQQQLVQIGGAAVASSLGDRDPQKRAEVMAALGAASQYGILLPFSRKHESEADHIGLYLMAAAGYDPREAVVFWGRMQKATGAGKPPEFASTHPSDEHRIRDLKKWLPDVLPFYNRSDKQDGERRLPRR